MREPLYFKDDDERLSFLFGNYITLTNLSEREIDRIIEMHISPIFVSVHTTNPQLRVRMLANKRGGEVLDYLPKLAAAGIELNCQLVLCRGVNDGAELRRTLDDLLRLRPQVGSVAAVPAGVTVTAKGCTSWKRMTGTRRGKRWISWKNTAAAAGRNTGAASCIQVTNGT